MIVGGSSNSECAIRQPGVNVTRLCRGILSCHELRMFWLSWTSDTVILGMWGNTQQGELLNYTMDAPFDINYVGLKTVGNDGKWKVSTTTGTSIRAGIYIIRDSPRCEIDRN